MKAKNIILTLALAAFSLNSIRGEVVADTIRPATQAEKAIVREMVKQGGRMAGKGVQLAAAALTNPARAEQIGAEMEAMGNEMERMGDSLEALSNDTTFLYDGEDEDSVYLSSNDIDNIVDEISKEINFDFGDTWWGRLLGGGLGIMAAIFAIFIVLLVVSIIIGIVTAPLWIGAIILYLILRNDRKVKHDRAATLRDPHSTSAEGEASSSTTPSTYTEEMGSSQHLDAEGAIAAERHEMWTSGVRQCCLGVGLTVFFIAIGWDGFWGIGALVACLGAAKLIIAYSHSNREK